MAQRITNHPLCSITMIACGYLCAAARFAAGMTLAEAAKEIGVTVKTLQQCERSKNVRPSTWRKVADYYCLRERDDYDKAMEYVAKQYGHREP